MARAVLAGTLALLLACAAIACGDGEDEPAGDGPLSAEEYREQAESICTEAAEELVGAFRDSLAPSTGTPTGEFLVGRSDVRDRELERLRELSPPAEISEQAERVIATRERALDRLQAAREAAEAGDQAGLDQALPGAEAATDVAERAAAALDLDACANRLPPADRRAAERLVELSATSEDARTLCRELATETFVQQFGGEEACIRGQSQSTPARDVEIERIDGVGGVSAQARIELDRPGTRLTRFDVTIVWEDGEPKVETIVSVPGADA